TGSWFDYGILSSNSDDSTIFGSLVAATQFVSYNCGLQYAGVSGVNPDSNYVLLAQLTTKGEIQFELNVEVIDTNGSVIKYVANDSILLADEVLNRYLKFPFEQICGCPDSNYVEYLADRDCNSLDSCKNLVVFGCMDTAACNYNPNANSNIQSLCCYPGKCNDRDLAFVCPQLNYERTDTEGGFNLFPSPAKDYLRIQIKKPAAYLRYSVFNSQGQIISEKSYNNSLTEFEINTSNYLKGIYLIKIENDYVVNTKIFIKD
ncbi:MAG TPA: T9SS type A sorting domain-containing protein, partial [Bacteroidia bacterium]|nr:T9SS type A sorting domain-containing protein [Bacteroidia bacterium]